MELVLLAACTYAAVRLAAPLTRALGAALEASRRPAAPTLKSRRPRPRCPVTVAAVGCVVWGCVALTAAALLVVLLAPAAFWCADRLARRLRPSL